MKSDSLENSDLNDYKKLFKRIQAAKMDSERKPNPRGNAVFDEENWFNFVVLQDNIEIKLFTYRISPNKEDKKDVKGVLVMFHGLSDHINNSAHIAKAVSQLGVAVVGFDFRGYGKSQGEKGLIEGDKQHFQDTLKFIEKVEQEYPGKKIFLSGQSCGGMTCFELGIRYPDRFAGAILFCPAIYDFEDRKFGKWIIKKLGSWFPRLKLVKRRYDLDSRNPQVVEDQLKDPFFFNDKTRPGTYNFILTKMHESHLLFQNYKSPFLLIQGGTDKLVNPQVANILMQQSPSQDKHVLYYEKAWHNLWQDECITDIIPKVSEWIKQRI